ncbi:MAG: methylated-DNA--[protein]-cysteine S-methyltransferase [Thermodesulfobacteriota bacterium]|nr:methylated-DNA--[protein]-cysteine S-methyltransferase [Thermodesulfobacteriota bacterium]
MYYILIPFAFGKFGIVWQETIDGPKVYRIFLSDKRKHLEKLVHSNFADISLRSCSFIKVLGRQINKFLGGEPVAFKLEAVALEECSEFQKKVLSACFNIPRGWISTYGRIAESLGIPGGARAVGSALSHNPFPLIIPCHRVVRSDGRPGGFRSGPEMKRFLLESEKIRFAKNGNVLTDRIYY